ncbi:hypothetical protein G9A89_022014 [Geosiphon pyriformis]|nr:hypothetical protein G9A89_022014 [Geosiphon pyriformis]
MKTLRNIFVEIPIFTPVAHDLLEDEVSKQPSKKDNMITVKIYQANSNLFSGKCDRLDRDDSTVTKPRSSPMDLLFYNNEKKYINVCAPMVRYSKLPFRELVRGYDVDLAYTPMILAADFLNSQYARDSEFTTNDRDDPLIIQFAAHNGKDLADAAELVAPYVNGIDLNCGCPQRWAISEGIGAHLLSNPELVKDMIQQVKGRGLSIPCSIKIRIHSDLRETVELAKRAESMGLDFLAVHGRTRHQKSNATVNLDAIKLIKQSLNIPVIANGDIFSFQDAERVYAETGVNGVMSARGILQNPALFADYHTTPWECIERFVRISLAYGTNHFIFHHHLMYMFENVMSKAERKTFNILPSIPAILDHLEEHYGLVA